jgi:esterase
MDLNYKFFGNGPALVILHGLFGSLDNWQTLAKQFADQFSVYIVDLPNHGRSPHSEEPMDYPWLAAQLENFLDSHELLRTNLIGHSMGGKVAMQLALSRSERIEKLVVADMAPVKYPAHHTEVFRAMDRLDLATLKSRNDADQMMANDLSDFSVRQFLLKSLQHLPAGGYEWKFNLEVIRRDYEKITAAISGVPFEGPALFIGGGKSSYIKEEYLPTLMELFPQATFDSIASAGHWLHAEAPEEFFQKVNHFLRY